MSEWEVALDGDGRVDGESISRLLRAWRARVDARTVPELRGTVPRPGRRLSQAQVARLTGVSEGWYRTLEAGRRQDFSESFLLRVAQALRLSEAETLTLFLAVCGRRPPGELSREHKDLPHGVKALLEQQVSYPAYLSDVAWNVVAANSLMGEWFPWVLRPGANLMRWALLDPEAREQMLDWEDNCARAYLAMLRVAANGDPGDTELRTLVRDILDADADCRRIWAEEHDVVEHRDGHVFRLRLPYHGNVETRVTTHVLLPIQRPDLRFVFITPLEGWSGPR
ncbi:helix-turn-helix transcriptional regulator [Streptomyces albireticuli]|uniref:Transcriptional regulator n=1 Tax=Streptomyces albireticuli TaxID=1940 RepID=A0A2A2DHJ2_9ACTN|nr:helix-turn-helix transcriptional regulator [Streptomyces albireticuli]MCD9143848.1 helix-turn-helix transcriptional regulator [Streptomyces albireticuli]MCD9191965.1 helix-turn-helix transcriptional regulator [Streptomyces albireticuli]PAU50722.1 transcriptional regulator [Streptomyces albireticuli]